MIQPSQDLSIPVECENNRRGLQAVIVYSEDTYPMVPPGQQAADSLPGTVGAWRRNVYFGWTESAQWMVKALIVVLVFVALILYIIYKK